MSNEVKHVGPKAVVDATALLDLVTATNGLLSTIDDLPVKQLENERDHFVVLARSVAETDGKTEDVMEREWFPFLVSIVVEEVSSFGVVTEREVLGFGCRTAEEREAEVERILARENAKLFPVLAVKGRPFTPGAMETRKHRAVFRHSCEVCKVTGVKPGCKRKKCEACGGLGSVGTEAPARMF